MCVCVYHDMKHHIAEGINYQNKETHVLNIHFVVIRFVSVLLRTLPAVSGVLIYRMFPDYQRSCPASFRCRFSRTTHQEFYLQCPSSHREFPHSPFAKAIVSVVATTLPQETSNGATTFIIFSRFVRVSIFHIHINGSHFESPENRLM